jgi:hypothetical protein
LEAIENRTNIFLSLKKFLEAIEIRENAADFGGRVVAQFLEVRFFLTFYNNFAHATAKSTKQKFKFLLRPKKFGFAKLSLRF